MLCNVHLLAEVGLRKDGQRVSGHSSATSTRAHAAHKVRYSLETPRRDALQGLARLEGDAVPRDLDLVCLSGAGLDVEAGGRVGRRVKFVERGKGRASGGRGACGHGG